MTNLEAARKNLGGCVNPLLEHHLVIRDTSCQKKPWGTKPPRKCRYNGHGSDGDGSISQRASGGVFSWQGTKYISFVGEVANLTINPNCSIMFRISSLIRPCCWQCLENTWSTNSMWRAPVVSIFFQSLECFGSYNKTERRKFFRTSNLLLNNLRIFFFFQVLQQKKYKRI